MYKVMMPKSGEAKMVNRNPIGTLRRTYLGLIGLAKEKKIKMCTERGYL
jgi:hypothetical protein